MMSEENKSLEKPKKDNVIYLSELKDRGSPEDEYNKFMKAFYNAVKKNLYKVNFDHI